MDIKCKKQFLWTSFIISAIFYIVCAIICILFHEFLADKAVNMYHLTTEDFSRICANAMSIWKIIIIQFTLIPAIALTIIDKKIND